MFYCEVDILSINIDEILLGPSARVVLNPNVVCMYEYTPTVHIQARLDSIGKKP